MDAERVKVKVGFGCSVYVRGLASQHLDGIGYYANELASRLSRTNEIRPIIFGEPNVKALYGQPVLHLPKFSYCAAASALTGMSFLGTQRLAKQVDLVHAPDHHVPLFKGIPVLATLMDAIPPSNPEWASSQLRGMKNALWKKSSTWADHILTISEFSKSEIVKYFKIDDKRISVVPLGVDERFFNQMSKSELSAALQGLKLPEKYFLFIGTLQPRKNLIRVIDAHQSLPLSLRREYPLVIVGRAGWGCDDLLQRLKSLPEDDPVYWLGGVDDLVKRALLQQATALVFASLSEGFGLPVLEAFAAATPVIASNTTSLPEVAGDAALMVDPVRIDEIAYAMVRIAQSTELSEQLISKGLSRAKSFTWDCCAEKTEAIYRQMI